MHPSKSTSISELHDTTFLCTIFMHGKGFVDKFRVSELPTLTAVPTKITYFFQSIVPELLTRFLTVFFLLFNTNSRSLFSGLFLSSLQYQPLP